MAAGLSRCRRSSPGARPRDAEALSKFVLGLTILDAKLRIMAVSGRSIAAEQRIADVPIMDLTALELPGAYLLNPKRFRDARGFFVESYNKKTLAAHGLNFDFVQDNVSLSARTGTIRGLHFQSPPSEQTKLVSVLRGAALDVLVDIRNRLADLWPSRRGRAVRGKRHAGSGAEADSRTAFARWRTTRWCSTRSTPITIRRAIWDCCGTIPTSAFAGRSRRKQRS